MSLLAEVLASARESLSSVNTTPIQYGEIEQLISEADEAKERICSVFRDYYVNLSAAIEDNQEILLNLKTCEQNIKTINSKIRDQVVPRLEGSSSEMEHLTRMLEETKLQVSCVRLLSDIYDRLRDAEKSRRSALYTQAVSHLNQAEQLIEVAGEKEVVNQLDIFIAIREECVALKVKIMGSVEDKWNELVTIRESENADGDRAWELTVRNFGVDSSEPLESWRDMLSALNQLGKLRDRVTGFGRKFSKGFIEPLVARGSRLDLSSGGDNHGFTAVVTTTNRKGAKSPVLGSPGVDGDSVRDPIKTLDDLTSLFTALRDSFSRCPVAVADQPSYDDEGKCRPHTETENDHGKNLKTEESRRKSESNLKRLDDDAAWFMTYLGDAIGADFVKLLIGSCLEDSLPLDRGQTDAFLPVQEKVERFHRFLVDISFYSASDQALLNFVSNVDSVCGRKSRNAVLSRARTLIMARLDKTVPVDFFQDQARPDSKAGIESLKEKTESENNLKLSPKMFELPPCLVSETICQLTDLIYKVLNEAEATEDVPRAFCTARCVLSLYVHITPVAHAHALETIPEYAALVNNNSMFLAHHAMLLGLRLKRGEPLSKSPSAPLSNPTAVDLAILVRDCGVEVFLKVLQKHKDILIDLLKTGLSLSSLQCNGPSVEPLYLKVQEAADHIQHLAKAWKPILPKSVYSNALGNVYGCVVKELVDRIASLEEISADDCLGLTKVLTVARDASLPLFDGGADEASAKIRDWDRLTELLIVLDSSMKDLRARWDGGKGPLAARFTAAEVKSMVRAIFRNTDRRAQFLAELR